MKLNKKALKIIITVTAILLVAVTVGLLAYFNQHRIFVFCQNHGIGKTRSNLEAVTPETEKILMSDMENDPRFTLDQSMMLINTEYTAAEGFDFNIEEYKDTTVYMNSCMLDAYAALSQAVTDKTGKKLYVSSDVRTREEQEALYLEDPKTATLPGASEHESGLCVDVYVAYYAGDAFLKSDAGRFVNSHAHKYGFIIRYPSYGEDSTGIRFEPWHIRYIGQPHAEFIYNNNLTLEQYIEMLEIGKLYQNGEYIISRQFADEGYLSVPKNATEITVSPDNTGAYIITAKINN